MSQGSRDGTVRRRRVDVVERILRKTDKNGPNGCWLFKGGLSHNGYGQIGLRPDEGPRNGRAHRVMLARSTGGDRTGMLALHKCDVRNCVNPEHLFWGLPKDNSQDMARKGRSGSPRYIHKYRGENNANVKVTAEQVRYLRKKYTAGGVTHKELAKEVGLSVSSVGLIIRRQNWGHLND